MLVADAPLKFTVPFGSSAGGSYIRTVPIPSQIGIQNGAASYTDGFPPLCSVAPGAGGVPPFMQDMNGLMLAVTSICQWLNAGYSYPYDATFVSDVSGYPLGAMLRSATPGTLWVNTVDGNTTNPDASGAGWVNLITPAITAAENFAALIGTRTYENWTPGSFSFTLPSGVQAVQIILTGGGGGATGCQSSVFSFGAGGGAGGTELLGLNLGGDLTITGSIGNGGAGGAGAVAGSAGQDSTVTVNGTTYTAHAGAGGAVLLVSSSYFVSGGFGGATSGQGVAGGDGSDGTAATYGFLGNGGASYWGGGRRAAACNSGSPSVAQAQAPGSGGGGAYDPVASNGVYTGGQGAPGGIVIRY